MELVCMVSFETMWTGQNIGRQNCLESPYVDQCSVLDWQRQLLNLRHSVLMRLTAGGSNSIHQTHVLKQRPLFGRTCLASCC